MVGTFPKFTPQWHEGDATVGLVPERGDISDSEKLGDQASPRQPETISDPGREADAPASTVAEQSVLDPTAAGVEERPRGRLVDLLGRISTGPLDVHEAWEDLRSMIEGVVGREFRRLEERMEAKFRRLEERMEAKFRRLEERMEAKVRRLEERMEAKFDALQSEFAVMRWMVGVLIALVIALLALIITIFIFVASDWMNSRPASHPVEQVEQTRDETLATPGRAVSEEPPASASGADLGTDAESAGSPADADPPTSRDTR